MQITNRNENESGREYALRTLKENIISLKLEPGMLVSEKELANALGMSRGPVREALQELEQTRIVEVYPQKGCIITLVDYTLLDEACFMRETLEIGVAQRLCSRGMQPEHIAELEENVKLQRLYLEHSNKNKLWELDNNFHRLLFKSAEVLSIYDVMSSMQLHFDRVRSMSMSVDKDLRYVDDHCRILDAILHREADTAKGLISDHVNRYQVDREMVYERYPQYVKNE